MKTPNTKFLIFLFLISFANIGCQDETCYSCDKEIDSWAKENFESLKIMNRNQLVVLSSGKQRAAFRTFTPEKRKQLWVDKFKQIKSLNFSKDELDHLKIIEKFLNKYDFSKELTYDQELFLNSWFEEGKLNFGWTPYFLVSAFAMLNEDAVLNKKEFLNKFPTQLSREYPEETDDGSGASITDECDCRWDLTCELAGMGKCSNDSCEDTSFGCGWLLMQSCTNDCSSLY